MGFSKFMCPKKFSYSDKDYKNENPVLGPFSSYHRGNNNATCIPKSIAGSKSQINLNVRLKSRLMKVLIGETYEEIMIYIGYINLQIDDVCTNVYPY